MTIGRIVRHAHSISLSKLRLGALLIRFTSATGAPQLGPALAIAAARRVFASAYNSWSTGAICRISRAHAV
jgi:hypothetical protein